jgi:L-fucose isomerase
MQILKHLSGGPVLFADVLHLDVEENMVRLSNCGSHPTELAPNRKQVFWLTEGLKEFTWNIGGACPQYVGKPGSVTLARMGRIDGKYIMLITTGEVMEMPREKLKETNWHHPHMFVKLDCDILEFVKDLRSNHIHMVYGDYSEHLRNICEILEIESKIPKATLTNE